MGNNGTGTGVAVPLDPATGKVASGQSVQDIPGTQVLYSLACPSAASCLGVGYNASGGALVPLAPTHW